MRILQVASEAVPLCKTGGLADVVTALSQALVRGGDDVRVLVPAYRGTIERADASHVLDLGDPLGCGATSVWRGVLPDTDVPALLVRCDALYERAGGPYLDASGREHPDNHLRFALLARVAATLAIAGPAIGWPVDVVHAHDWQAALAPAYLAWWGGERPATVLTVHNLAFVGRFGPHVLSAIAAPPSAFAIHGLEFYGAVSFLKGGLYHADRITTVSPTYAQEIRTTEGGEGFDGLLRARGDRLHGILNGIDDHVWNPAADSHLATGYDATSVTEKRAIRSALAREVGLAVRDDTTLFGSVGRLSWQKGLDILLGALPALLAAGGQLVVLGTGDPGIERALAEAAHGHPGRVAFHRGYSEGLAHRVVAGSDAFVVPSRFEPCGLTQMYALRYGTPPVVRRTGGLADTVLDDDAWPAEGTGFVFAEPHAEALADAIARACAAHRDPRRWRALQARGMARDFSWSAGVEHYRAVYRLAQDDRRGAPR